MRVANATSTTTVTNSSGRATSAINTPQQSVWGTQPGRQSLGGGGYVDELVQIAVNGEPTEDPWCEVVYWTLQDANYNVLGVVDAEGTLVERYEYTPYGERKVYRSAGSNDPKCHAPTIESQRCQDDFGTAPYVIPTY